MMRVYRYEYLIRFRMFFWCQSQSGHSSLGYTTVSRWWMSWSLGFQRLDLGFLLFRRCCDLNPEEVVDLVEIFLRRLGSPHRAGTGFGEDWTTQRFHAPTAVHQSNRNKCRIIKRHGESGHSEYASQLALHPRHSHVPPRRLLSSGSCPFEQTSSWSDTKCVSTGYFHHPQTNTDKTLGNWAFSCLKDRQQMRLQHLLCRLCKRSRPPGAITTPTNGTRRLASSPHASGPAHTWSPGK